MSWFATRRESVSFQRPDRSVTEFGSMRVTSLPPQASGSRAVMATAAARLMVRANMVPSVGFRAYTLAIQPKLQRVPLQGGRGGREKTRSNRRLIRKSSYAVFYF